MADCRLPKAITSKMKEEGKKRLATDWLNVNFLCGMKRTGHSWMENWKIKISDRSEILIEIMLTQYNRKLESIDYIHSQPRTTNHRTMSAGSAQIESKKQLQYRSPILPQDEMMSAS